MFAQTLLLAFACAPLLKGPVLRSLGMTQEDLNQFEGIIATAWDQWDYGVRIPCFVGSLHVTDIFSCTCSVDNIMRIRLLKLRSMPLRLSLMGQPRRLLLQL